MEPGEWVLIKSKEEFEKLVYKNLSEEPKCYPVWVQGYFSTWIDDVKYQYLYLSDVMAMFEQADPEYVSLVNQLVKKSNELCQKVGPILERELRKKNG